MAQVLITSIDELDLALELIYEKAAETNGNFDGGIIFSLPEHMHMPATFRFSGRDVETSIKYAWCGIGMLNQKYITRALTEDEGYFVTEKGHLLEGAFIAATASKEVFENAVRRFFSQTDFTKCHNDPVTRCYLPW